MEIRNAAGAVRTVAEGDFSFAFSVFEPSTDITIVLIGKIENLEWKMTKEELARMR
jgi:hypothetical protein